MAVTTLAAFDPWATVFRARRSASSRVFHARSTCPLLGSNAPGRARLGARIAAGWRHCPHCFTAHDAKPRTVA